MWELQGQWTDVRRWGDMRDQNTRCEIRKDSIKVIRKKEVKEHFSVIKLVIVKNISYRYSLII